MCGFAKGENDILCNLQVFSQDFPKTYQNENLVCSATAERTGSFENTITATEVFLYFKTLTTGNAVGSDVSLSFVSIISQHLPSRHVACIFSGN